MRSRSLGILSLVLLAATAASALAEEATSAAVAATAAEVSIPFAHTNIRNWTVVDNQTVLIQTNGNQWYKAKLLSPCTDLPFIEQVGFESNADGSFDRFSTIRARGQTCSVVSLTKSTPPPKQGAKKNAGPPKSAP